MKLRPITIALFAVAVLIYVVAPPISAGLVVVGIFFELAGWVSLFSKADKTKTKDV